MDSEVSVDWYQLKEWVLGSKDRKKEICKELGFKPFDLRKFCFNQVKRGIGEKLYTGNNTEETGGDEE
jgi:hypothetical protein